MFILCDCFFKATQLKFLSPNCPLFFILLPIFTLILLNSINNLIMFNIIWKTIHISDSYIFFKLSHKKIEIKKKQYF